MERGTFPICPECGEVMSKKQTYITETNYYTCLNCLSLLRNNYSLTILQMPHILTLYELLAEPRDTICDFLEVKDDERIYPTHCYNCYGYEDGIDRAEVRTIDETFIKNFQDYNKTWRCWSSAPDDNLRKSVPWE